MLGLMFIKLLNQNKMKTALEWLESEILKLENKHNIPIEVYKLCEKAIAMEKEQIIRTHLMARCYDNKNSVTEAEEYYNETFKSE